MAYVRRHYPGMSDKDVEDIVQTAFARHFQYREHHEVANPLAHLYQLCAWIIPDVDRRKKRDRWVTAGIDGHDPLDDIPAPPAPWQVDVVETAILLIREWLHQHRPADEEIFLLRARGIPHKEIARHLGESESVIRQRFCRASAAIRSHVSELGIDEYLDALADEGARQ
jgi:DNA-directed RNA polymerase specialized sigma24 family protein